MRSAKPAAGGAIRTIAAHLKYLRYVLRHKWYVALECLKLGVPIWIAVLHDWDKFLPDEWFAYVAYFYGPKVQDGGWKLLVDGEYVPKMIAPPDVQRAFDYAWNLHQKRNKHHWQFWLLRNDDPRPTFLPQSYDGGMTHATINRAEDGKEAALLYGYDTPYWKADPEAQQQLEKELWYVPQALDMPNVYRREMLADWHGAGKALGKPDTAGWYESRKDKIQLHPETRAWIEKQFALQKQIERTRRMFEAGLFG